MNNYALGKCYPNAPPISEEQQIAEAISKSMQDALQDILKRMVKLENKQTDLNNIPSISIIEEPLLVTPFSNSDYLDINGPADLKEHNNNIAQNNLCTVNAKNQEPEISICIFCNSQDIQLH